MHLQSSYDMAVRKCLLAAVCLVVVSAQSQGDIQKEWQQFKTTYGKSYPTKSLDQLRMNIFAETLKKIEEHNDQYTAEQATFRLGVNKFADMLPSEVSSALNGVDWHRNSRGAGTEFVNQHRVVPDSVDWRTGGLVSPVRTQGMCASDWAISSVEAVEGQYANATGQLEALSVQQLVDCCRPYGSQGCSGGWAGNAYACMEGMGGLEPAQAYPAANGSCQFDAGKVVVKVSSYVTVSPGDEDALKQAVATIGPLSAIIDASHMSFQMYQSGVYYEQHCSDNQVDHAVLVAGYGSDAGADYWLVKNSWGAQWGSQGYIKMARNRGNNCGIVSHASYPLVQCV